MELNIIFLKCYYVAILVRLKKDKKPKVSINGRELADIPTSFSFFVCKKQFLVIYLTFSPFFWVRLITMFSKSRFSLELFSWTNFPGFSA